MNPAQRSIYFALWSAACTAQGWSAKDSAKRQEHTARCMSTIRGPAVASTTALGEDDITALFCYLTYLGTGDADLDAAARWVDCQQDYRAYARARQADWHEVALYGKSTKPNRLDRNRFAGAKSAVGEPLEAFDPEAIRKRHLTMATRHQKKARSAPTVASPARPAVPPVHHLPEAENPEAEFRVSEPVEF